MAQLSNLDFLKSSTSTFLCFQKDEISDFSDDDDEPVKSAAELLSQQFGMGNGYGEEEEYY